METYKKQIYGNIQETNIWKHTRNKYMETYKRVLIKIGEILGYTTIAAGFTMAILLLSTILTKITH